MAWVYILESIEIRKFYIGATTETPEVRLDRHLTGYYHNKFTKQASDWTIFLTFECNSVKQAISIENHIKKMKSSTYIRNLKNYPEMIEKLKQRFTDS